MSRLLERLEALTGRRCPGCGKKEWRGRFESVVAMEHDEDWLGRPRYRQVHHRHRTCGHSWDTDARISYNAFGGP